MTESDHPFVYLAVLLGVAVLFCVIPLLAARLWAVWFSPVKPGPIKSASYECGLESRGDAWIQVHSEFYLYALVFLIFDIEAIFLFPFAAAFTDLSVGGFLAMVLFLGLLVEGLVWAWLRGLLEWRVMTYGPR